MSPCTGRYHTLAMHMPLKRCTLVDSCCIYWKIQQGWLLHWSRAGMQSMLLHWACCCFYEEWQMMLFWPWRLQWRQQWQRLTPNQQLTPTQGNSKTEWSCISRIDGKGRIKCSFLEQPEKWMVMQQQRRKNTFLQQWCFLFRGFQLDDLQFTIHKMWMHRSLQARSWRRRRHYE